MKRKLIFIVFFGAVLPIDLFGDPRCILNNTKHPIDVNIQLPAYTQAIIELKKLPKEQLKLELLKAIYSDSEERVKLAVAAGADVNEELSGIKPIIIAMSEGPNALKALVECGADLNISYEGHKFAAYAKNFASIDSLCFLVEHGVEFQGMYLQGGGALMDIMDRALCVSSPSSINKTAFKLVKALVTAGYKINEMPFSTVTLIASNTDILKYLLQNGLNPNLITQSIMEAEGGKTPLFAAIEQRNIEALKILLEASADPNLSVIRYGKIMTPISACMPWKWIEGIELLLEHGASL